VVKKDDVDDMKQDNVNQDDVDDMGYKFKCLKCGHRWKSFKKPSKRSQCPKQVLKIRHDGAQYKNSCGSTRIIEYLYDNGTESYLPGLQTFNMG
jgi:hypothetical protein